jgi:hypothetical protein
MDENAEYYFVPSFTKKDDTEEEKDLPIDYTFIEQLIKGESSKWIIESIQNDFKEEEERNAQYKQRVLDRVVVSSYNQRYYTPQTIDFSKCPLSEITTKDGEQITLQHYYKYFSIMMTDSSHFLEQEQSTT